RDRARQAGDHGGYCDPSGALLRNVRGALDESAVELRAAPGAPSATRQGRCDHAVGGCVTVLVEELRDSAQRDGVEKFVVGAVIHQDGSALVVTRSELDDFLPGIDTALLSFVVAERGVMSR